VYEFRLPDLGEGIHEGEILRWHVAIDQELAADAPLLDVETDKAAVTIPSPRAGVVCQLEAKVGDTVKVGTVLAVIDDGLPVQETATPSGPVEDATPEAPTSPLEVTHQVIPAAPATRRLARELGIDLRSVSPTGPGGRVTPEDVHIAAGGVAHPVPLDAPADTRPPSPTLAAAEYAAHAASTIPFLDIGPLPDFAQFGPITREPLRSIRRRVAHKMVTSMVLVPHVAHMDEADVTLLEEFRLRERERRNGQPGGRLTLLSFIVKAVTAGLRAAPVFNSSLDPFAEEIVYKDYYNIGVAVDTGRGLVVPVLHSTDRRSIISISTEIEALATAARDGEIDLDQLRGGTFTITNVGPIGGTALIPTINYPEVAILGMGRVQEKPVVRDGEIVIRKMLPLTLAFDHRVADGADAARFVAELARQLSDPNFLLLEA